MKKLFALALLAGFAAVATADEPKRAPADPTKTADTSDKTIAEIAMGDKNFSTLVEAVKAAGLAETLGKGEYTVLAPTNAAFEAVGKDKVADLMKDKDKLAKVLKAHVIKGSVMAADVAKLDGKEVETLDGSKFKVTVKDKDVMIGTAKVTKADIKAKNGVIHVIDAVLMPTAK